MAEIDWSVLGQLGQGVMNSYQEGRRQRLLSDINAGLADPNPNYGRLAGLAAEAGDTGFTTGLLRLGQEQRSRTADAEFYRGLAQQYGGQSGGLPQSGMGDGNPTSAPAPNGGRMVVRPPAASDYRPVPAGYDDGSDPDPGVAPRSAADVPLPPRRPSDDQLRSLADLGTGPSFTPAPASYGGPKDDGRLSPGLPAAYSHPPAEIAPGMTQLPPSSTSGTPAGATTNNGSTPTPAGVPLAKPAMQDAAARPAAAPASRSPAAAQPGAALPEGQRQIISGLGTGQLLGMLANPDLSPAAREFGKTLLAGQLDNNKNLPEGVKEYLWARANGQAMRTGDDGRSVPMTYTEFKDRNAKDKDDAGEKIAKEVAARTKTAASLGLQPGTPEFKRYVAEGKIGRDDPPDHRAILAADDAVAGAQNAVAAMQEARRLSAQAYSGPTASARGTVTGLFGSQAGQATTELTNTVTGNAVSSLKSIFGGNPTEGERKVLLDLQGSASQPQEVRDRIFARAEAAAQRRLDINQQRATELRGGSYYRPGGGSAASAAPQARSPARAPARADAGARFDQLTRSGMSKADAYAAMAQEGY